jgi:hypothetical protein
MIVVRKYAYGLFDLDGKVLAGLHALAFVWLEDDDAESKNGEQREEEEFEEQHLFGVRIVVCGYYTNRFN